MVEYIERKEVLEITNAWFKTMSIADGKTTLENYLKALPTADVVERSKIDKAKTNIETMLEAEKQEDGTYTEVGKGIAIALGLLKHNIGE